MIIKEYRYLTVDDVASMQHIADYMCIVPDDDNDSLKDSDFRMLSFIDSPLKIVHGWPGDNSTGVIYDALFNVIKTLGECGEHTSDVEENVYDKNSPYDFLEARTYASDAARVLDWFNHFTNNGDNSDHVALRPYFE